MEQPNWESFVNEFLLKNGAITGISLFSHQGSSMYSMGLLKQTSSGKQFLGLFDAAQKHGAQQICVSVAEHGQLSFQIHQKTHCSLYATSAGSHIGLLVGNLPHGILICTFTHREPHTGIARKQFEHVCSLLRS